MALADMDILWRNTREHTLTGQDGSYLDHGHRARWEAANMTVSMAFSLDQLYGTQALFSKDASGHDAGSFTVWVKDGQLMVSQDSDDGSYTLRVPQTILAEDTEYHISVSFGADGLMIWLNGSLAAAEPTWAVGLGDNANSLLVGGSRAWRDSQTDAPHSLMKGTVSDLVLFERQLNAEDAADVAGLTDQMMGTQARMALMMEDLAPGLAQLHHGSDTLRDIAMDYGFGGHGHGHGGHGGMPMALTMAMGNRQDNNLTGTDGADGINGMAGDDVIKGAKGSDVLQGGYGNDKLYGAAGRDVLDGGHGEDRLYGGAGNDLLISRSDGREGLIAYDPDRDEGDPYNELTNGKLYPDQPIPGDDALWGGAGADIFYFQTLINGKERYIQKHTNDDGSIRWHGVAGENDKLHDHWVDKIGHTDYVMDYSRAEGDRIVIEGHTTEIRWISYGDQNSDGVMDYSTIALYSNQGSGGGAHANDDLGYIRVYGDLVKLSDIETDAAPAYGIVKTIDDLDEAITPSHGATSAGKIKGPGGYDSGRNYDSIANGAVYQLPGTHSFAGGSGDYMDAGHMRKLELANATVSFGFKLDQLFGLQALVAKDGSGLGDGGGFGIWVRDGKLQVHLDQADDDAWLTVPRLILAEDTDYHISVSFGDAGMFIWLNGSLAAALPEFKGGIEENDYSLTVGASRSWRNDQTDDAHSRLNGEVRDVVILDGQITAEEAIELAAHDDPMMAAMADRMLATEDLMPGLSQLHHGSETMKMVAMSYGISHHGHIMRDVALSDGNRRDNTLDGTTGDDGINGREGDDMIKGRGGDDILQGGYGNDKLYGATGDDILDGGHGEDKLYGGAGNDLLISQADGREGLIKYDPDRDEGDPYNELTNGKLYPDQPIPGDDGLWGGSGADIFYFQTLINGKARYLEEHTNSDGTIRWHGVAGENDKLHDHWVDVIGQRDMVMDFDRSEGDRLIIEGHTTQIRYITYGDTDGDGVLDASLIALYSDQGNGGGAHNDDDLGYIQVFGDLVRHSDIEHTAGPAYGIVKTIDDLEEAVTPVEMGENDSSIKAPKAADLADSTAGRLGG
ncbi:MAG: LamG-like jellyroll fold domain-containing protein, partial [Pseudomonadota bacterium]